MKGGKDEIRGGRRSVEIILFGRGLEGLEVKERTRESKVVGGESESVRW